MVQFPRVCWSFHRALASHWPSTRQLVAAVGRMIASPPGAFKAESTDAMRVTATDDGKGHPSTKSTWAASSSSRLRARRLPRNATAGVRQSGVPTSWLAAKTRARRPRHGLPIRTALRQDIVTVTRISHRVGRRPAGSWVKNERLCCGTGGVTGCSQWNCSSNPRQASARPLVGADRLRMGFRWRSAASGPLAGGRRLWEDR